LTMAPTKSFECNASLLTMIFILLAIAVPVMTGAADDFEVKTYLDRDSGGWMDKTSDYAFVVERNGCKIKWNAVEEKSGKRWLEVRRNCKLPFSGQAPIHRAILRQINSRWPLSAFKFIGWGSFCDKYDWSWCIPIAKTSALSEEYIQHIRKYKSEAIATSNHIFIKLANQTNSYKELSDIVQEFGVTISLKTVQKVFSLRLRETPFYDQMKGLKIKGNPRVMYDVGEAYFYIGN
jgi:hypothetical protein